MRSKKVIKNISSSLISQFVNIIVGFVIPSYMIKKFGSNVYGLTVSITQFLLYISLLESGFGPVIKSILYKPLASKDMNEIKAILKTTEKFFKKIAYIFIIYIIILCFVYPFIVSNQFDVLFTISLIVIISISTFFEYFFGMTYKLFLQSDQKAYIVFYVQIITNIINVIIIIFLIKFDCSIMIVKLISSIVFILRPIILRLYVKRNYSLNLSDEIGDYKVNQKWDGLAQHIAAVVNSKTDIVVLTIFSSISNVAIYSVYALITNGIKSLISSINEALDALFGDMIARNQKDQLNSTFKIYEYIYYTIITIVYTSTFMLLTQFISIYTKDFVDTNYVVPVFGIVLTLSVFMNSIRLPYASLSLSAGHFKETQKGAWIEAFLNIIISIVLVRHFGLIGVAIGTFIAMLVRTIEFMYHASKCILSRELWYTYKRLLFIIIESITCLIIIKLFKISSVTTYLGWIKNAIIITSITSIIVITINSLIYRKELIETIQLIKNILKRKQVKQ